MAAITLIDYGASASGKERRTTSIYQNTKYKSKRMTLNTNILS